MVLGLEKKATANTGGNHNNSRVGAWIPKREQTVGAAQEAVAASGIPGEEKLVTALMELVWRSLIIVTFKHEVFYAPLF
jgi:hypothetical protein